MQFMSQIITTPYTNIKRKPTSIKEIEKWNLLQSKKFIWIWLNLH